jgi:hypothetical protein
MLLGTSGMALILVKASRLYPGTWGDDACDKGSVHAQTRR